MRSDKLMFKLGFPIWYGYRNRVRELARESRRIGFDYVEVSLDHPWPFSGNPGLDEAVRAVLSEGLSIAFHAPWRDLRLSSPLEEVRSASIKVFRKVASKISSYECDYLVVHLSTDQAIDRIEEVRGEVVEAAVKSVGELNDISRELGLKLMFENVREDLEMFKVIASKSMGICLDAGHVIVSTSRRLGREHAEDELRKWLTTLKDKIRIIHYSGVKFNGKWVRDHQITDSSDRYLRLIRSKLKQINPEYFLLEVFEGRKEEEHARPSHLADAVRFLKSL